MVELVVRQICFGLAAAVPDAVPVGPFRLGDAAAEALSELLQVLACGEESAALAFAHFGCSLLEDAARRGLALVAEEELIHERLRRRVRAALPPPAPDRELRRALLRFYHGIAQADIGLHLASPLRFAIEPPAAGEGIAVLVQAADGRVLGAAALQLKRA
jgi:hypothetical protein